MPPRVQQLFAVEPTISVANTIIYSSGATQGTE